MVQWIMGLNAINSLARTIRLIAQQRTERSSQKVGDKKFSDVLQKQMGMTVKDAEAIVSLYDADQDKKVSMRESGLSEAEFQRWDVNKDGYITAQEIQMLWSHLGPFKGIKD